MLQESAASHPPAPTTGIIHADYFIEHDTGFEHPESPLRYIVIVDALRAADFASRLCWLKPRAAEREDLTRCHLPPYVEIARRDIQSGMHHLTTGDTTISRGSWDAAVFAAGGVCTAVDAVMQSMVRNAFCVLRPPGHHATPDRGMGFCVFNNVAIGARFAQAQYGIGKVLIVDWDVHHGNGTQDIFYEDDSVFFFSTHQWPWYPGSGARDETGHGRGLGTTMNRPFSAGAGRKEIVGAFADELCEKARHFKPELILISAGFDARQGDPLGGFLLTDEDFADLTRMMRELADEFADGRLISVLEGGYHLGGLASAAKSHCRALAC